MRKELRSLLDYLCFETDIIDEDDHFRISSSENDVIFFFDYLINIDPHKKPQEVSGLVEYFPSGKNSLDRRIVNTFDFNRITEVFKEWINLVETYHFASTDPNLEHLSKYQSEFEQQYFQEDSNGLNEFRLEDQVAALKLIEFVTNHLNEHEFDKKEEILGELGSIRSELGKLSLNHFKQRFSRVMSSLRMQSFSVFASLVDAIRLLMLERLASFLLDAFTG